MARPGALSAICSVRQGVRKGARLETRAPEEEGHGLQPLSSTRRNHIEE